MGKYSHWIHETGNLYLGKGRQIYTSPMDPMGYGKRDPYHGTHIWIGILEKGRWD